MRMFLTYSEMETGAPTGPVGTSGLSTPAPAAAGGASAAAGARSSKKEKSKMKKKKMADKPLKLCIIGLTQENDLVECQLETAKNHTVNFKFNYDEDEPHEIASNLVGAHVITDCFRMDALLVEFNLQPCFSMHSVRRHFLYFRLLTDRREPATARPIRAVQGTSS